MHRYAADTTTDTTLVTTAETVVATLAGVSLPRAGHSVDLEGHVTLATGTATTGLTLRVRRDGLTGVLVLGRSKPTTSRPPTRPRVNWPTPRMSLRPNRWLPRATGTSLMPPWRHR
jgi:hypothetical protein